MENTITERLLDKSLTWISDQLTSASSSWSFTKVLAIIAVAALVIYLILKLLEAGAGAALGLKENIKKLGFFESFSDEIRTEHRRRSQFCGAIASDLATLAKSENWNDQYFADLEAEVEAEGRFFASKLHRLFHIRSAGIHRSKSLMKAIQGSAENKLLLVGDPGSGKSIALRHLASQYAEAAKLSRDSSPLIPLYINLRELPARPNFGAVTGSYIRDFVLEHVKRGDSDIGDYVREKWEEFKRNGQWFFLLDSFDEIPDVLHADNDDEVIRQYAEAIRHFLDSASNCRAIIASREFKGPRQLPWHKVRILPLREARQEELIQSSFLTGQQKALVQKHVAISDGHTYQNPMFLGLLCRFVKDKNDAPTNDHQLLVQHTMRLAYRETRYLESRFGLTADETFFAAKKIAAILATDERMSLSPTFELLIEALGPTFKSQSAQILDALVYLKIGRTDLPNSAVAQKRFAFSHRRYQETLFVLYLRESEHQFRPRELLTQPKWREYVVTFIESQDTEIIRPLIDDAISIFSKIRECQTPRMHDGLFLGKAHGYFDWIDDGSDYLLRQLKEGFSRKPKVVPQELSIAVEKVIIPRMQSGDLFDIFKTIEYSGLMRFEVAEKAISYAMRLGYDVLTESSTRSIAYMCQVSAELRRDFLQQLSDRTIEARSRIDLLRLEVMANRMEKGSGASIVFRRSRRLNWFLAPISRIYENQVRILGMAFSLRIPKRRPKSVLVEFMAGTFVGGITVATAVIYETSKKISSGSPGGLPSLLATLGFVALLTMLTVLYVFRSSPAEIGARTFFKLIKEGVLKLRLSKGFVVEQVKIILILAAITFGPGGVVHLIFILLGAREQVGVTTYFLAILFFILVVSFWLIRSGAKLKRRSAEKLNATLDISRGSRGWLPIVFDASGFDEVEQWLDNNRLRQPLVGELRTLLRLLAARHTSQLPKKIQSTALAKSWSAGGRYALVGQLLASAVSRESD